MMTTSGRCSVMLRFRCLVLFVAMSASIGPPSTRADEPPAADKDSAEAVLLEAGLTRKSNRSHVLQEEISAYGPRFVGGCRGPGERCGRDSPGPAPNADTRI